MTAPDPGLTDLIAAHREGEPWTEYQYPSIFSSKPFVAYSATKMVKCSCGESMPAESHPAHVAEMLTATHTITPKLVAKPGIPCDDWADGHSYRKCTRPKGHEGHHG